MEHMSNHTQLERGARHRLVAIGLPHHLINPFVDLAFRWVSNNGPEWAVSRFKSLKVDFIRRKAGLPSETTWVRKNKRGLPYGVLGSVVKWSLDCNSRKGSRKRFNAVLQALNIATLFTSNSLLKAQREKFLNGVNCDAPLGLTEEFITSFQNTVKRIIPLQTVQRGGNSLLEYTGSTQKWAPQWHKDERVRQSDNILSEMEYASGQENYLFAWEHYELYAPVVAGIKGPLVRLEVQPDNKLYGGEVHFLQEPGLKLRAIASPYRIHQLALKPLQHAIAGVVQRLPWDCTFDQSKAIPWIQLALKANKTVHSVDLTGATDYFPLGLQSVALRSIFGDIKDIKLFEEISRLPFKSEIGDIQWKRGQPLGLRPSFAAFTLTHGLLLFFLSRKKGYSHDFFVVGDDVVILDDKLFQDYLEILDTLKCPWSPQKSLSSNLLSEFAGKVITKDAVLPSYKWRKMSNDNFLDICRNLGPRSDVLLTKAQKKVYDAVKHLLLPIGCNFSYPGSNLTKMYIETERFLRKCEKRVMRSLVDLTRVIHKNSYGSHTPYALDTEKVDSIRLTFDEKVNNVFRQTIFARCEAMWRCVAEIPEALGLSPRLPPESCEPSRVSTLQRYERRLATFEA